MSKDATPPYRTALVTGASSGLGHGLALWLAKRGVKVYAAARRTDRLEACAASARDCGAPGEVIPLTLDVASTRATLDRLRTLDADCGGLDLVIANAGVGSPTPGKRLDWDAVQQVIDVNVTGAAATLSAVLPRMLERGRGHLVGISSLAGFRGLPGNAAYSGSKAFLTTFLASLAVDLGDTPIKVTAIYPGFVKSEMTQDLTHPKPFLLETEDAVDRMGRAIVRGAREFAFPWQMAAVMQVVKRAPSVLFDPIARKVR